MNEAATTIQEARAPKINRILILTGLRGVQRVPTQNDWKVLSYIAENMDASNRITTTTQRIGSCEGLEVETVARSLSALADSGLVRSLDNDSAGQEISVFLNPNFLATVSILDADSSTLLLDDWENGMQPIESQSPGEETDDRFSAIRKSLVEMRSISRLLLEDALREASGTVRTE